jgi:hypothetical protein
MGHIIVLMVTMRLIVNEEMTINLNNNNNNSSSSSNNNNNNNSKIMLFVLKRDQLILLTEKVKNMFSDWNGEIDVSDHV